MSVRWLALGLSLVLATAAYAAPAASDKPAAKTEKPAKAAKKTDGKTPGKKPENLEKDEPKLTTVDKLPKALKAVHVCAMPQATVEIDRERYAKSMIFFISCTAAKGGLTPFAVYTARDGKGTAARLVTFEGLKPDGTPDKLEMLYSVTPAREAFTREGDQQPHAHVKDDTPWFVGAWAPDDRPGVCAVAAQWKLQDDKAELYLWEEAKECPKGALPKYESKVDKKPPALVGR
jgi:hypothetical protein